MSLYRQADNGDIENVYVVKILNMDGVSHAYRLTVRGMEDLTSDQEGREIRVAGGEVNEFPVRLRVPAKEIEKRSTEVYFDVVATDNPKLKESEPARFLGPVSEREHD